MIPRLALLALMLGACSGVDEPRETAMGPVAVMSYNLAGQLGGGTIGENLAAHIASVAPDFVAVQEANDGPWLLSMMPERYALTAAPRAGVGLIYDSARWQLRDGGAIALGSNDDGWGERLAMWGLFADAKDRGLYVYSTHWCVTIRNPDDACDAARQLEYADAILDVVAGDLPLASMVAGDLNVFDGFETGTVISHIIDSGLVDLFREFSPDGDVTTFIGNSWAPPGRIDYIFATPPVEVVAASIDSEAIPPGEGSDHYAVRVTVSFPGAADEGSVW